MQQRLKRRFFSWRLTEILIISLTQCLAITSLTLGVPNIAYAQSTSAVSPNQTPTVSAVDAFRTAYENRYTWDEKFPGYSVEVSIDYEGKLVQGIARIKPDLSVEVMNINNKEVRELITNQLRMEVIHRRRIPFEKLHGQNSFELEGKDESGALKIREMEGDRESRYKVQDRVITQVNRQFGDVTATVDTLGIAKNPEGYCVTHFQTTFRDAKTGALIEKQDVQDVHEKIGNYYLLTSRTIRSTKQSNSEDKLTTDTLIRFNNIKLL